MERVYELGRVYRNEGISQRHNPEFTMLEVYQAYGDYRTMMDLAENLIVDAIRATGQGLQLPWGDKTVDFTPPFARKTYDELFAEHTGISATDEAAMMKLAQSLGIDTAGKHPDVIKSEIFEAKVEDHLVGPVFVTDYPASICPLTKRKTSNPAVAERFELIVQGMELANAYTELNDPDLQDGTFQHAVGGYAGRRIDGQNGPRFPAGHAVWHAAGRGNGDRHRSAGDAADEQSIDTRCDSVSAVEAGNHLTRSARREQLKGLSMYKLLLCWRYLRTRWIALASIVSVTLGVATMIVVNSVMEGFRNEMQQRIHGILSDLVFESNSLAGFYDADWHMDQIRQVAGDYIEGMTPTVVVPAMLSYEFNGSSITRAVQLIGIDERTQSQVGDFCNYLQHPANRERISFHLRDGGYDVVDHQAGPDAPPRPDMADAGWAHRRKWVGRQRMLESMQPRADRGDGDPSDPFAGPVQLTAAGVPLPAAAEERTEPAPGTPDALSRSEPPLLEETRDDANPLRGGAMPLANNETQGRPDVFGDDSTTAGCPDSEEQPQTPLIDSIAQTADEGGEPAQLREMPASRPSPNRRTRSRSIRKRSTRSTQ